jgi:hypothetical protein
MDALIRVTSCDSWIALLLLLLLTTISATCQVEARPKRLHHVSLNAPYRALLCDKPMWETLYAAASLRIAGLNEGCPT